MIVISTDTIYSEEQYLLHFANTRELNLKIEFLDYSNINIITDNIEGIAIDGSISLNADSSVRRSCSLKIALTDSNKSSFLPAPDSHLWLNRKFRLKIGLKKFSTNEVVWYNQGIFIVDSPSIQISNNSREISFSGLDSVCELDGTLNGFLMKITEIDVGIPVATAIRSIFTQLGGIDPTRILIDDSEFTDNNGNQLLVPYKISKNPTDSIYSLANDLVSLYKGYELFFDINGFLVCRKIKNKIYDLVKFPFDTTSTENRNLAISIEQKNNFKNVKNHIQVYGQFIVPLVATPSTDNKNENTSSKLVVYFNYPLYDSNNQPFVDGTDMTSFFTYSGTASNYTKAIYNIDKGFTVTFTVNAEDKKFIQPVRGKIFNSCAIEYWDDKYEYANGDQYKWSLPNAITIDYTNNSIVKFVIKFNKPLYNSNGVKLATNTDVKSYFAYSGIASNLTSATYITDGYNNEIDMIFSSLSIGDTLDIVANTIYDSAGFTIDVSKFTYLFNGTEWYQKNSILTSDNQIQAVAQNNIEGHKFSISAIGKRSLAVQNDKLYTKSQAQSLADYTLWQHDNFSETISLSTIPVYLLDVNQVIYIRDDRIGVDGKYSITSMSIPLKLSGNMTIDAYLIYDENVI